MAEPAEQQPRAAASANAKKKLQIKSVLIQDFRSYSKAEVSNFSSGHNCVVGLNGSGKSNFFAALEFVLGEREFSSLSQEDRQKLLHQGGGSNHAQIAQVEVTFDNSEHRLPIPSDEVKLRRSVGLKKDEFFINGKHVNKSEVADMLETAGFSQSNPYYICRQGKVAELCLMSDAQRLNLLKEIAGTTVYDTCRKESEKLLEDAEKKTQKINEDLTTISARLTELQQEKEDLEKFRALDKDRRTLEYVLNTDELKDAEKKLDAIEQERLRLDAEVKERRSNFDAITEEYEAAEQAISSNKQDSTRLDAERKIVNGTWTALAKTRASKEIDLVELRERVNKRAQDIAQSISEKAKLDEEIAQIEERLTHSEGSENDQDGLELRLDRAKGALGKCRAMIERLNSREDELRSKQGRNARFGNDVTQRNHSIDQEIQSLKDAALKKSQAHKEFQAQRQSIVDEKARLEKSVTDLEKSSGDIEDQKVRATASLRKCREAHHQASDQKRNLEREASQQERTAEQAKQEMEKALVIMSEVVPGFSTIRALDDICKTKGVNPDKVYGPLMSLIRCENPNYRTAVEVAAGNQLSHVVVDSDDTAAKLMEGLLERRAGRVTFKPLNVLVQRERAQAQMRQQSRRAAAADDDDDDDDGPVGGDVGELVEKLAADTEIQAGDAIPLVTRVSFDEKFAPAVRAILGKTLLCRNPRVASECSRKYRVNCVTLDGEQFSHRGALTGGYIDIKKSRLAASEMMKTAKDKFEQASRIVQEAKLKVQQQTQEVSRWKGEAEKFENEVKQLEIAMRNVTLEVSKLEKQLRTNKESLAQLDDKASSYTEPTDLEKQIKELEDEKGQPPLAALKSEEKEELLSIPKRLDELHQQQKQLESKEDSLKAEVLKLRSNLNENLLRRRDELQAIIQQGGSVGSTSGAISGSQDEAGNVVGGAGIDLERAELELEAIIQEETDAKNRVEELDREIKDLKKKLEGVSQQLEKLRSKRTQLLSEKENVETAYDKILGNRRTFTLERDKAAKKIRELGGGMLDPAEVEKKKNTSKRELTNQLEKISKALKQFSAVNKRALDNFVNFSEKRQALVASLKESKQGGEKIRELIVHLDRDKDAAIETTFKQVSRYFREIFSQLVPNGVAELRMVKGRSEEEDEEQDNAGRVSQFVGVSPRVSFVEGKNPVPMKLLSGGQKALVALTLIFAIQQSDPAPFYLFDEIDQALDQSHRTAVAALIQRQAAKKGRSTNGAQFITTTFRPELVGVADKCFGIKFANKTSEIGLIDTAQALNFVRLAQADPKTQQAEQQSREALQDSREEVGEADVQAAKVDDDVVLDEEDNEEATPSSSKRKSAKKAAAAASSERSSKKRRSSTGARAVVNDDNEEDE